MEHTEKPRVFLSSALKGLEDLRSTILSFLYEKKYFPIYYGDKCSGRLTGKPGIVEQCLDGVHSSNAFFLIVDKRYGDYKYTDDEGNKVSLTELEFLEANKLNLSTYIFCRTEVWTVHKVWETNQHMNFRFDEAYDSPKKLMMFLTKLIQQNRYIPKFENAEDLKITLHRNEYSFDLLKSQSSLTDENENLEANP